MLRFISYKHGNLSIVCCLWDFLHLCFGASHFLGYLLKRDCFLPCFLPSFLPTFLLCLLILYVCVASIINELSRFHSNFYISEFLRQIYVFILISFISIFLDLKEAFSISLHFRCTYDMYAIIHCHSFLCVLIHSFAYFPLPCPTYLASFLLSSKVPFSCSCHTYSVAHQIHFLLQHFSPLMWLRFFSLFTKYLGI